jgi:hypothetical protein
MGWHAVTGTLNVQAAALVRHATGRHSDAMACDAIGYYVRHVGAVPDGAWGSLSWTQKWKVEWGQAVDDRAKEARLASERFGDVGQTLYQVAADYAHTDIKVAADFGAIQNSPIMPFVTALERQPDATARPGGQLSAPASYAGGNYTVSIPDDTPEGHDLNNLFKDGAIDRAEMWPAGTDLSKTPTGILRAEMMTEGRKKLWEFINEWSGELGKAEAIVRQWGIAPAKSSLDLIDEASDAWPGIIANRANLLKLGANAYRDLKDNLGSQVKDLQQYWSSPGASGAYYIYADSLAGYDDAIADHLQWLGEEGEKAAQTIDDLQLAYANLGYQHISIISAQLQAYNEAVNSLSHAADPAAALADAISGLVNSLIVSWQSAAAKAQAGLDVSQKAIDGAPHFADNNHDLEQPPQSPSNDWRTGWKS